MLYIIISLTRPDKSVDVDLCPVHPQTDMPRLFRLMVPI